MSYKCSVEHRYGYQRFAGSIQIQSTSKDRRYAINEATGWKLQARMTSGKPISSTLQRTLAWNGTRAPQPLPPTCKSLQATTIAPSRAVGRKRRTATTKYSVLAMFHIPGALCRFKVWYQNNTPKPAELEGSGAAALKFYFLVGQYINIIFKPHKWRQEEEWEFVPSGYILPTLSRSVLIFVISLLFQAGSVGNEVQLVTWMGSSKMLASHIRNRLGLNWRYLSMISSSHRWSATSPEQRTKG